MSEVLMFPLVQLDAVVLSCSLQCVAVGSCGRERDISTDPCATRSYRTLENLVSTLTGDAL